MHRRLHFFTGFRPSPAGFAVGLFRGATDDATPRASSVARVQRSETRDPGRVTRPHADLCAHAD